MKKKILAQMLTVSMAGTLFIVPAKAEDFTLLSSVPENGARMVDVVDDLVVNFSQTPDFATLQSGITVTPSADFTVRKVKNGYAICFINELAYETEYTVSFDGVKDENGAAITADPITFKTEYDPLAYLFVEDFENGADSLKNFTLGGQEIGADNGYYEIAEDPKNADNHVLKMTVPSEGWSSLGYYPVFAGSGAWQWYSANYDIAFGEDKTKVNFLIKGDGDGILDSSKHRNVIEHYFVNSNYTVSVSKRENAPSQNWNIYAHLSSKAMGGAATNALTPANVTVTGGAESDKLSYTFNGVLSNEISSNDTPVDNNASGIYLTDGATGILTTQGTAYVDNIRVADNGWTPQLSLAGNTQARKNVEGTINVYYNGVSTSQNPSLVKVTKEDGTEVASTATFVGTYPRHLEINITEPESDTKYIITIPSGAVNGNANAAYKSKQSGDKVFSIKTPYQAFTVTNTTPANKAVDVDPATDITIGFSGAVDFETLEGNITVDGAPAFTVSKEDDQTCKLTFNENLAYGKVYTVKLTDGVKSADGKDLNEYAFSFTTIASTFGISKTTPSDNSRDVSVLDDMSVYFNEDVDFSTVADNIEITPAVGFKVKEGNGFVQLVFDEALEYYTTYKVEFKDGILSAAGMPMGAKTVTFKTVPNMGKALFYENFDGDADTAAARFEEIGSANRHESENFYVSDNELKLPSYYSGATNQADKTIPMIKGSENWSDCEVDADIKLPDFRNVATSMGASATIMMRYGLYGAVNSFIGATVGDTSNNGIISATLRRDGQATNDPYCTTEGIDCTDWTSPEWINVKTSFAGTQNNAQTTLSVAANGEIQSESFSSATKPADFKEAYVIGAGGIAFQTLARTAETSIDNILVNDLSFWFEAENEKNNEGTVKLIFNQKLNEDNIADMIKVYDGETEVEKNINVTDGRIVTVTVKDPESGKVYRVKALSGLTSANGAVFADDRYVDMSVQLSFTVKDLKIMSGESEISELSANGEIYASAAAESLSDNAQNVTLILAVYDADGALSQVKINKQEITSGKVVELKTDSITLPSDVTGFKASVFCWDNLVNIKPVSGFVTIPQ